MAPKGKKGGAPDILEATEDPFVVSSYECIAPLHSTAKFPSYRRVRCSSTIN